MRYLAERAARRDRALDRMGEAAHGRKDQLANMAALGKPETKAKAEVTAPPRAGNPNKVEAATAQRVASGKEFTEAFRTFLARENAKERTGRDMERGGTGGRDR